MNRLFVIRGSGVQFPPPAPFLQSLSPSESTNGFPSLRRNSRENALSLAHHWHTGPFPQTSTSDLSTLSRDAKYQFQFDEDI